MSDTSKKRSQDFLKIADQFKLGELVTESSHSITANLSEVGRTDVSQALKLLFQVDADVVAKYREFVESGRAGEIAATLVTALRNGGRIFFTGCGATGRLSIQLDSIWRDFWHKAGSAHGVSRDIAEQWENRTFSVMAGGDYALIKSVEGFEDYAEFGKKQLGDLDINSKDVVFAITEGGETSFVIGTAWKGVEVGAKVWFIYNNPDDVLCRIVERSRAVIEDPRIEKINLTTGPMAIMGSTRMQATSIQLCVMATILEMVARVLMGKANDPDVPQQFLAALKEMHATLGSPEVLSQLAKLVELEESIYKSGQRNNYFADQFSIDVLTDTTERSPTFCTPAFRKFDDDAAAESWAFLFLRDLHTPLAWERILKRKPRCVEWSEEDIRGLVLSDNLTRTRETLHKISTKELLRFRIGIDGRDKRPFRSGDGAVAIVGEVEKMLLYGPEGFYRTYLYEARDAGAKMGFIFMGNKSACVEAKAFPKRRNPNCVTVAVPVPQTEFLLDGATRVGLKMLLNALSTCTMVRLGRVMGNTMIWVVASNLKLIDRATRYVSKLTGLNYDLSNELLFEAIEYVEPRMKADQSYPPVVGLAVMKARDGLTFEEAERKLSPGIGTGG
jgi:N-acetylmuramic acid 6-phosphate etherase